MPLVKPAGYRNLLDNVENTEKAIKLVKDMFQQNLSAQLALLRVTAPMVVLSGTGINDDLNSVERPVSFPIRDMGERRAEVVHSLAKWKRYALARYHFPVGEGLYTDMNAIRRDEELDNLHSVYVDQWDWEKVITPDTRNLTTLKNTVTAIVGCVCNTLDVLKARYNFITTELSRDVFFITTQELLDMYPDKTPKERENAITKEHRTVFIMQIGDLLSNGEKHDGRSPDYDDWKLNGDILFYDDVLDCAMEISSMGIRVDAKSMDEQLTKAGCDDRRQLPFHKMLLNGELPLTIGGGIGQSRLCMLLLGKAHIGEVQSSVWDQDTIDCFEKAGVTLL